MIALYRLTSAGSFAHALHSKHAFTELPMYCNQINGPEGLAQNMRYQPAPHHDCEAFKATKAYASFVAAVTHRGTGTSRQVPLHHDIHAVLIVASFLEQLFALTSGLLRICLSPGNAHDAQPQACSTSPHDHVVDIAP